MRDELEGLGVVVTGGASGIGAAAARLFAAAGAMVAVADRDMDGAGAIAAAITAACERQGAQACGRAVALAMDVAEDSGVEAGMDAALAAFGRIDILVNSAGFILRKSAFEISPEEWDLVQRINVRGTFLCARAAARRMDAERGGAIVNLASIMGFSGGGLYPNPAYQTSKGAVVNLTRALAVEWAARRIRVNAVAPTWVRTPMIGDLERNPELMARIREATPMGRLAEADEVARAILFLAGPGASMTTGHILAVDGGYLAV
jgi:NAD(P)-dependent dehydrogenase (short-subunit alcohol dehydrogenase family)